MDGEHLARIVSIPVTGFFIWLSCFLLTRAAFHIEGPTSPTPDDVVKAIQQDAGRRGLWVSLAVLFSAAFMLRESLLLSRGLGGGWVQPLADFLLPLAAMPPVAWLVFSFNYLDVGWLDSHRLAARLNATTWYPRVSAAILLRKYRVAVGFLAGSLALLLIVMPDAPFWEAQRFS